MCPADADYFVFKGEWYSDGDSSINASFFSKDGEKKNKIVPREVVTEIFGKSKEVAKLIRQKDVSINFIRLIFFKDGGYKVESIHDPELDAKREAGIKEAIGVELYEKYQRDRR